MSYTQRFYEDWELLAVISPQAANGAVGEHNTGWVDVSEFHRIAALVLPGEPGGASTIDIDVEEATSAAGAGAQDVTGVAPNQVVAADAGEPGCIEFQTEEMDAANDYRFVNIECTIAVNTYTFALFLFGYRGRYKPVGTGLWREIETTTT